MYTQNLNINFIMSSCTLARYGINPKAPQQGRGWPPPCTSIQWNATHGAKEQPDAELQVGIKDLGSSTSKDHPGFQSCKILEIPGQWRQSAAWRVRMGKGRWPVIPGWEFSMWLERCPGWERTSVSDLAIGCTNMYIHIHTHRIKWYTHK